MSKIEIHGVRKLSRAKAKEEIYNDNY